MRTMTALISRNRKLFFRDRGMFLSSLITPVILIVLYATFLANVYKDSFLSALPDTVQISDKLINGTVAAAESIVNSAGHLRDFFAEKPYAAWNL